MVNWYEEVLRRKDAIIKDLFGLLEIESVKDVSSQSPVRPMGEKVGEALDYMLNLSLQAGFTTKNLDGYVGYLEDKNSRSDDYIGILCHLDVVPATGDWTSPPFQPTIRDGKIFARGAIDDKGPTIAAFYGLKMVKELGLPMKNNVRIIFGTDEESGMSCIKHYREVERMPALGFAPDADFPIIHAEKGQINVTLSIKDDSPYPQSPLVLHSFKGGNRINMVPESAVAIVEGDIEKEFIEGFELFCHENGYPYKLSFKDAQVELKLFGLSAHGMEPHKGENAATALANYLSRFPFQKTANQYLAFCTLLHEDFYGESLGINYEDSITGPLTVNPGVFSFEQDGGTVQLNIRCPVSTRYELTKQKLADSLTTSGFTIAGLRESQPHHVEADHPMIKVLQKVYQEETNLEPTLLSTGGATYAKFMEYGVAFGACFPGKLMTAHQKDEYIEMEDLLKATAIYARAIYELANLDWEIR
ncbi:dipeptidase PepV [Pseudoneobacillus sp. C159]